MNAGSAIRANAAPPRSLAETIYWRSVASDPPDDETTVLIYTPGDDEPVWIGWLDDGQWFGTGGKRYVAGEVRGWAEMPAGAAPR